MPTIPELKAKAEELKHIREQIAEMQEAHRTMAEPLEARRDELQEELILMFRDIGVSSIKTDDGGSYTKSVSKGIEITNEVFALKWAMKNLAVSINKTLVKQKLKDVVDIPDGFAVTETEFIKVTPPKRDEQNQ